MAIPTLEQVNRAIGAEFLPMRYGYGPREAALYALGIGAPADFMDANELRSVYELSPDFQVIPTMAALFSRELIKQMMTGDLAGITYEPMMLVHGEQQLRLHGALPRSASVVSQARIVDIQDKGSGALIIIEVESATENGQPLAQATTSVFIRGIGGYGGHRGESVKLPTPDRPPDITREDATLPTQALLYRLSGDANPLHADPKMAALGGYPRPILHGLCTFGFAARAIIKRLCGNEAARLLEISARFASHVFPGETLVTEIWTQDDGEIRFQTRVKERDAIALSHARARLAETA